MTDKEQITFDGIPIPLTMETILDAMEKAALENFYCLHEYGTPHARRPRQITAFRARILRLGAELREDARWWKKHADSSNKLIDQLNKDVAEKDKVIQQKSVNIINLDGMLYEHEQALAAKDTRIAEYEDRLADKYGEIDLLNARIAELEGEVDIRDKALDDSQVDLEMWRE